MISKTPVVLFAFKRLDTVKMIVDEIRKYQPDRFYIFADGARDNVEGEVEAVNAVRAYLNSVVDWDCDALFYFHEENKGCDNNIREGLDRVFKEEEKAIVFEDDAIPTQSFFAFCDELLERYKGDKRVHFIAGFNALGSMDVIKTGYTFGKTVPMNGAFATWSNRWNECDFDMKQWPFNKKNRILDDIFFYRELRNQYYRIYEEAYEKKITAWDYMFEHDMLSKKGLAVVPRYNLVTSYGFVEGAYHPQRKAETVRFKALMTAECMGKELELRESYDVVRNAEYDRIRQKKLIEIKGNFVQRVILNMFLATKEFAYNHLSKKSWNTIKKITMIGKSA